VELFYRSFDMRIVYRVVNRLPCKFEILTGSVAPHSVEDEGFVGAGFRGKLTFGERVVLHRVAGAGASLFFFITLKPRVE